MQKASLITRQHRYDCLCATTSGLNFAVVSNGVHIRFMRRTSGVCRFGYNKALALQVEHCQGGEKKPG
ncbi:helix-turn-helix domain-containing protein [Paraburkholderia youngii]|uniref:helix-turn-helix domain-containing protein n=1 Tax=Paraburkholderia youngii TaxID=2782701 RepID=UPI003D195E55